MLRFLLEKQHIYQIIVMCALLFPVGSASYTSHAAPPNPAPLILPFSAADQHEWVLVSPNNLVLPDSTLSPPVSERAYRRYGFYISSAYTLDTPATQLLLLFDATVPEGSDLRLDLRGSSDGQRWTTWQTSLKDESVVSFDTPVRMIQYRATLLGSATDSPVLRQVAVQRSAGAPRYHILAEGEPETAPTYTIRATRLGMVGGRTANNHIIQPNDRFVALPSWRSLNSPGGYEYQVRITYQGRSVVAPVWDVGPWNTHDDYWSANREQYSDLPRGWPQDHAAYYEGYNSGYAEKGYVRYPTAMDVGDGVWRELGIVGDQGEVEVTFLWVGSDPQEVAPPAPDPNASEFVVKDQGYFFRGSADVCWYHSPGGCGEGGHALWTYTTSDAGDHENEAIWQPDLPTEGMYDVYVHVPVCPTDEPVTQSAHYRVQHRDGEMEVVVDQQQQTGWVLLGQFPFGAGRNGSVHLSDVTDDSLHVLWFDDVKWVPVRN